jgi:type III secretion system YscD/HrpQ family protein
VEDEPQTFEEEPHHDGEEALSPAPAEEQNISQSTSEEAIASPETAPANDEQPEKKIDHLEDEDHISIFEDPFEEGKSQFPHINFDLTETGRWLLKVVGGPNQGAEFSMQPTSTYIIGTDPNSCDIVFHDTSVSRQHAKITVNDDETILLEDLKSRNGTFIDGKQLNGKDVIPTNTLIAIGTSSFVVYDREGAMQTIISPLLPSIVKVLQNAEEAKPATETPAYTPEAAETKPAEPVAPPVVEPVKKAPHTHDALGAFILIAIITGLFVVIGIGTTTLFKSQPVVSEQVIHPDRDFTQALSAFPSIKYSFNRSTGRLLLVGHVLTSSDKNQLLYNLQGINYIRNIDDSGVIIDEGVWREINQILSQNQNWKGISIQSPTPGHFVISGFLKTRKQAEQLWDYISSNFPYLDLLEKRVIVEEDVVTTIGTQLQNGGFKDVSVQMNEGDVILTGHVLAGKLPEFNKVLTGIKEIPGVRNLKNFVTELAPEQSMINISDKYDVSGVSREGTASTSVVINGRILTRGDILDGMTITSIKSSAIFLEKDGVRYRIDYSR